MNHFKSIAVFCGSSPGKDKLYAEYAIQVGRELAERNIELIYGGGRVGLMGILADSAIEAGGKVTGIIPEFLNLKEIAHSGVTRLIPVKTMHERKAMVYDLSDGIITLPGGYGTLDELFEILTWGQLGLHPKPVALLNVDGYFDPLLAMIGNMVDHEFLNIENSRMLIRGEEISDLLEKMSDYEAPKVPKWKEIFK